MANTYVYDMSDLWSNPLLTFTAIGMNVTDSGSTADSSLLKLQVGGSTRFNVIKDGSVTATSINLSSTSTVANLVCNNILRAFNSTISNISFYYEAGNNTIGKYDSNSNNNIKVTLTNANTGNNSAASLSIHDTTGITTNTFVSLGIFGNAYNQDAWTISGASSGYVYTGNTNLVVGTAGAANVVFFAGGTLANNERFRITSANQIVITNSSAIVAGGSAGVNNAILTSNVTGVNWSRSLNIDTLVIANTQETTVNSTSILLGNTSTANAVLNTTTLTFTNSSSTSVANTSTLALGNGAANAILTTSSLAVQNGSASIQIVNPANLYVSNSTGFNLGSPTKAANGSSYLPNGLLANWGWVSANTSNSQITFTTEYSTACYIVQLTPAYEEGNNAYLMAPPSTAGANVRNSSTGTGSNVYYFALGV